MPKFIKRAAPIDAIRTPRSFSIHFPRQVAEDSANDLVIEVRSGNWLFVEDGTIKTLSDQAFQNMYHPYAE